MCKNHHLMFVNNYITAKRLKNLKIWCLKFEKTWNLKHPFQIFQKFWVNRAAQDSEVEWFNNIPIPANRTFLVCNWKTTLILDVNGWFGYWVLNSKLLNYLSFNFWYTLVISLATILIGMSVLIYKCSFFSE